MAKLTPEERDTIVQRAKDGEDPVRIPLGFPIRFGKQGEHEIDELNIRRPKVGDAIKSEIGKPGFEARVLCRLAEQPMEVIERMDLKDFDLATDVIAAFVS